MLIVIPAGLTLIRVSPATASRFNPRSFARFIGEPSNARLNSSCVISRIAGVRSSRPAITSRAARAGCRSSDAKRLFHGHTSWEN